MPASSRLGHYRRSCDRCHDQKLRCKKDDNSESCQRCQRAKAKCTFSARSRLVGPFIPSHHTASAMLNAPLAQKAGVPVSGAGTDDHAARKADGRDMTSNELDICTYTAPLTDIPPIAWDHGPLMFPLDLSANTVLGQTDAEWDAVISSLPRTATSAESAWVPSATAVPQDAFTHTTPAQAATGIPDSEMSMSSVGAHVQRGNRQSPSDDDPTFGRPPTIQGSQATINRAVRKLSDLSVELHDFALTIPPIEACWKPTGEYQPLEGKEFALDRILELSQRFIETLNQLFYPSSTETTSGRCDDGAATPDSMQSAGSKTPSPLNQPNELLALSSYTHIVETYHTILEHVAACANSHRAIFESRLRPSLADSFPRLPSLAIGSFTMESSSATQVLVLVHMIEIMMTRSRYLIQCMIRAYAPSSSGRGIGGDAGAAGARGAAEQSHVPTVSQAALEGFRSQERATLQLLATVRRALLELGNLH